MSGSLLKLCSSLSSIYIPAAPPVLGPSSSLFRAGALCRLLHCLLVGAPAPESLSVSKHTQGTANHKVHPEPSPACPEGERRGHMGAKEDGPPPPHAATVFSLTLSEESRGQESFTGTLCRGPKPTTSRTGPPAQ